MRAATTGGARLPICSPSTRSRARSSRKLQGRNDGRPIYHGAMTLLAGKHVQLRRVEPGDYPAIQVWQNDPEVFYWMDYERAFSLDDIKESETRAVGEGH